MDREIFIPFNTPSLKNSKIATARGVFQSKTVTTYLRNLGIQHFSSTKKTVKGYVDITRPNIFKKVFEDTNWKKPEEQIVIGFHFVRGTRHKFDVINMMQIIQDLMVAHDFIEDDDMTHLIPMSYKKGDDWFGYNKEKPGCYIKVLNPNNC